MKRTSDTPLGRFSALIIFLAVGITQVFAQGGDLTPEEEAAAAAAWNASADTAKALALPAEIPDAESTSVQAAPAESVSPTPEEDGGVDDPVDFPGFLIPIDGDVFYEDELKVLVTLPGNPPASMVLLIDGYPENNPLNLTEGLLTVTLNGMQSGVHILTLLLFNERTEITAKEEVRFFVKLPEPKKELRKGGYKQFGRVVSKVDWKGGEKEGRILSQSELSLKNPATGDTLRAGKDEKPISQEVEGALEVAYNLKYKQFQASAKALGRTDETRFRQPAHRISANVKYGPWASLKAGDVYPQYNPLVLSGTRIRGGEGTLNMVIGETQWGSLRVVSGESRREVPAFVARYDTGGATPRVDTVPGSFAQDLVAARLGLGGGPTFDLGFTLLKAKDRESSDEATRVNNFLNGVKPVENLVPGIDMRIGFWDGRIQLYGEYAMSLFTKDRSLGAFSVDSFDVSVDPKDFEDQFVFNATTRGWQYLVTPKTSGQDVDIAGFVNVNSAYNTGFTSSIPLSGVTTETELRYSHLGLEYHSEGNPFLGGNPGDGFTFIQRLLILENRLNLGLELGNYNQDLGFTSQVQRTLKGEVRFTPGPYQPSFVVGGGRSNIAPVGDYPHQFKSSFLNFNTGVYHQFQLPVSKLHASLVYGFTQDDFDLQSDTLDTPATTNRTNIVNASAQYKRKNSDFIPKINYSFANNGIQKSTNSMSLGFLKTMARNKLKVDVMGTVGQYPETNEKNDISLGQAVNLDYLLTTGQNFRIREKWTQYGNRKNILVGANYELFF